MDNLPTTLQGMKDYVRGARSTISREKKRIEDLSFAIVALEPKIKLIEQQLKERENGDMERSIGGELSGIPKREV